LLFDAEPKARARTGQATEALEGLADVFDLRHAVEGVRHELAPLLEISGAAEIDGVVLHGLPGQEQAIPRRLLDRALQRHRLAALGALEILRGLGDAGLEFRFEARLDVDLCDFEKHGAVPAGRGVITHRL
jgi:hypothetical protein